jgi:hypothetical protein
MAGTYGATTPPVKRIRSAEATHFRDAIAQNAVEHENITITGVGKTNEYLIESISVQSDQNLAWDIFFWRTDGNLDSALDSDTFVDFIEFAAAEGKRIAGANQYYYAATGLSIVYIDSDRTDPPELHLSLVNRSSSAKNAGDSGSVVVEVLMRPLYFAN